MVSFVLFGCSTISSYENTVNDRHIIDGFQSPYTNETYPPGTVINGYILPPEPDHEENDKTLLGIDVNHNGMRDDVERYIVIKESKHSKYPKTWTSIELQIERGVYSYYKTNNIRLYQKSLACLWGFSDYMSQKNIYVMLKEPYTSLSSHGAVSLDVNTQKRKNKEQKLQEDLNEAIANGNDVSPSISYCDTNIFSFGELP
jgi:hypothetical protein